jgi:hypothetical protein
VAAGVWDGRVQARSASAMSRSRCTQLFLLFFCLFACALNIFIQLEPLASLATGRPELPRPARGRRLVLMAVCEVCGNDYRLAFEIHTPDGSVHVFDSFECAITQRPGTW